MFVRIAMSLGGSAGTAALDATVSAVRVVARNVIGRALVEAALLGTGFWLVGLPQTPLLVLACFVLQLLQIGSWPVWMVGLVWLWLVQVDHAAAVALLGWVVLVAVAIRLLDKRMFAHRSQVPRSLLFLAVLGGLTEWGFSGIFLGAAVVSIAWSLMQRWLDSSENAVADG